MTILNVNMLIKEFSTLNNHLKANNLVKFGVFTVLYKTYLFLVTKYFHHPNRNPVPPKHYSPIPSPPITWSSAIQILSLGISLF